MQTAMSTASRLQWTVARYPAATYTAASRKHRPRGSPMVRRVQAMTAGAATMNRPAPAAAPLIGPKAAKHEVGGDDDEPQLGKPRQLPPHCVRAPDAPLEDRRGVLEDAPPALACVVMNEAVPLLAE